mgnify:CR=1 FL=1
MAKIILVEDDPMISEIYQKKMEEAGFEVKPAITSKQAIEMAERENADLMLLDLILPQMNGFEVLEKIKSTEGGKKLKVIIFSNLSSKEERDKALQLGASGFITKSEYTPSQLVEEVKRFINQYNEQQKNEARLNGQKTADSKSTNISGKKRILMIEDEEIFIDMFGEKLRQDGYDLTFAKNGAWGVKEALKNSFDLFIIDMIMPAMTGEEIVSKLKLEDKTKNIPIIMLSASVDDSVIKKMEELGIQGFYIKTQITPAELSRKVSEALGV